MLLQYQWETMVVTPSKLLKFIILDEFQTRSTDGT